MLLEENLKVIKDAKLDIELLRRDNEKKCMENNIKIDELTAIIEETEEGLEIQLKDSGLKKLECKLGWCSYRVMPDKWEYDEAEIISYCKLNAPHFPFYKTIEMVKKAELKKAINDKMIQLIPGVTVTKQDPKFGYKLNGGI